MTEQLYPTNHDDIPENTSPEALGTCSRRSLLRAAGWMGVYGAVLGAAGARSWGLGAELLRDNKHVSIEPLHDSNAERNFPNTACLFYPGLKNTWDESARSLKSLQSALSNIGQMASVGFSNQGFNENDIFDETMRYCRQNKINKTYLIGESFSGILVANLTPRLAAEGIDVPANFLLSSPSGPDDVADKFTFDWMLRGHNIGMYPPEVLRFAGELWERIENKNERSVKQILDQSFEQMGPKACSSKLVQEQAVYINNARLATLDNKLGDTQFTYFGNDSDTVVNFNSSIANWSEKLPHNFVKQPYLTGDAYHASAASNSAIYCQQINRAAQDLGLLDEKPKRTVKYY